MPAWVLPAVMGAASLAGGLMGSSSAKKAMKQAIKMQREAAGLFDQFSPPTPEEMYVALQDLQAQGVITPEMAESILMEESAYTDITRGGEGRDAEYEALSELRNIVGSGGLTASDKANIQSIQDELATTSRGERGAIEANMRERGIQGSGLEYMNKLMAQQSGAESAARQGMDAAAMAEQRALEAIMAQGGLGGQITQQEFAEQAEIAKAKDAIEQFNVANRRDVELENIRARNVAQAANLKEQQRLSDFNVQQGNMEALRRADMKQQHFQNQMEQAKSKAAALVGAGQSQMEAGKASQDFYGRIIGAGGQIVGATAPYWGDSKKKTPTTETEKDPYNKGGF